MLRKVRIIPAAQSGLEVKMRAGLGFNANQLSWPVMAGEFSEADFEERQTLGPVDLDEANLEAEVGETVVTNLNGDGIPEHYKIGGKRHYDGGTPLNLPNESFIFSRDRSMKIKDPVILEKFGITSAPPGGLTPADIAKKFNINKFKKTLLDKDSDKLAKSTAEMMIANYNLKLGMLALLQESLKGFPQGIPFIAAPYLESIGLDPNELLMPKPTQGQEEQPDMDMPVGKYGGDYYQEGGSKKRILTWKPGYNKNSNTYAFYLVDENGNVLKTQTQNPKPNDNRSAEEAYKQYNSRKQPATSAKKSAAPAQTQSPKNLIKPPYAGPSSTADYDKRLGENNDKYYTLYNKVNGDEKIKDDIYANYRARILANKKLSDKQKDTLLAKGKDEVIKTLLEYQRQNYAIDQYNSWNNGIILNDPNWDTTKNNTKNAHYKRVAAQLEFTADEIFDDDKTMIAQAAFAGLVDTSRSDAFKSDFKDYNISTGGPKQSGVYDEEAPLLSDIDSIYGNNTAAALFMARDPEVKKTEEQKDDETRPDEPLKAESAAEEFKYDQETPFWLQDIIKTSGAAADMGRIKKYMPWQAVPNVDYMDPSFVSPERELAANAEQLAIGAQGAAQFTGPQAYNARYSQLAGKASANAADILGRYNNINVGIANETEKFNVQTFNQYAQTKAANATALYDKVNIANQQYDNAKNKAREQLRQSYIDAITNRAQTDVLNTLYPQFAVNPLTGGTAYFRNPKKANPNTEADFYEKFYGHMKKIPGGYTPQEWGNIFLKKEGLYGKKSKSEEDEEEEDYTTPNPGYPD